MSILKKPLITEKATASGEKLGQYGFIVAKDANKVEIKKAIEKLYSVTVASVNTMNAAGKVRNRNTKTGNISGMKGQVKKAIVTLKKGETIDFYSSI
ncbi:50S ribosomal protein L23 [soil metagenome]